MAGKQHHTLEVHQAIVDGGDGFQIQVVGGLIQHQHVRTVEHHTGEHTPNLLAAGEDLHRLEHIVAGEQHPTQEGPLEGLGVGLRDLGGELEPDEGTYKWGTTITTSYFPLDNSAFFNGCDLNLVDWLAQYTPHIPEANTESFKRAFLGRMLFSGDDVFKPVKVLSGGEKVRCMLSRMMLYGSNVLVLDQPTNHLDLESITAVNNGLADFKGNVLFASHDHEFIQTVANRIMEFKGGKLTDYLGTYDDFIESHRGK